MLSKSLEKYINSLRTKKQRYEEGRYILEGEKVILELLGYRESIIQLIGLQSWIDTHDSKLKGLERKVVIVDEREMKKISALQNLPPVIAIASFPGEYNIKHNSLSLLLDGLQDPGNLGTIIRA